MANTFMIEVPFNSRPLYANVYVHTPGALTYHVNLEKTCLIIYQTRIMLINKNEKLQALDGKVS